MRQVIWNKLAVEDYLGNIDFILRRWSEKEAQKFINEVEEILFILGKGNIDFQRLIIKQCRLVSDCL